MRYLRRRILALDTTNNFQQSDIPRDKMPTVGDRHRIFYIGLLVICTYMSWFDYSNSVLRLTYFIVMSIIVEKYLNKTPNLTVLFKFKPKKHMSSF